MFQLTRRERCLVAGLLAALVVGAGVRHWRQSGAFDARPAEQTQTENADQRF